MGSSVFQILSLIFVLGYLFGVLNLYFSDKNNYCIMTYMFEYPQFVVSIRFIYDQSIINQSRSVFNHEYF